MTGKRDHEGLLAMLGAPGPRARPLMASADALDGDAETILARQVGPPWRGFASMSAEGRAVAGALADRIPGSPGAASACEAAGRLHAHETGVLLALSAACPSPGGASVLGLPPLRDPVLRAILASRGRGVVMPEALGPVAQWLAEKGAGRPLPGLVLTAAADAVRAMAAEMREPVRHVRERAPAWAS